MPTFVGVNLALGSVAIVFLLAVRPATRSVARLVAGLFAGVLAGILAINAYSAVASTGRDALIRTVIKELLAKADPSKTQILIVGSSYTALGVDGDLIQQELHRRGNDVQVLELARPGNFMLSQDFSIDYYLARAKKIPDVVFLELGPEYYVDTGRIDAAAVTSASAIADHPFDQLLWRVRSIEGYVADTPAKVAQLKLLGEHFLYNVFDFGLAGQLVADQDLPAVPGFTPSEETKTPLKPDVMMTLEHSAQPLAQAPMATSITFLLEYRRHQIRKLMARGVKVVGFFQPTAIPDGIRVYGIQVCRELPKVPCISGDADEIRKQLDDPKLWFDQVHLLHSGAELFSKWLAGQLAPYVPRATPKAV